MFLSSRTRLLSRFILEDIFRKVDARSSALGAVVVGGVPVKTAVTSRGVPVTSPLTSRGVPATASAPLHGASQRVGDVITAEAEVTEVNRQSTVEKTSSANAAATSHNIQMTIMPSHSKILYNLRT